MKIKSTPPSRLSAQTQRALELVIDRVCMFDRLTIEVDHPDPIRKDIETAIQKQCADLKIHRGQSARFQPNWQTKIELYQPSKKALHMLAEGIKDHRTKVNYVEIACDWITQDSVAAQTLYRYLLAHVYVNGMRQGITFYQGTAYFKKRVNEVGTRHAKNVVLYADKPSKLFNARTRGRHCCHLEYRFTDRQAAASIGLLTIGDCTEFRHRAFWLKHLQLYKFKKIDVGRVVSPEDTNVSGTILRRRADDFLDQHSHGGTYVLQDCVIEWRDTISPSDLKQLLQPIDNRRFFVLRRP